MNLRRGLLLAVGLFLLAASWSGAANGDDLTRLSLEELTNLEVTIASPRPQFEFETPAAVYVITGHQIRRAGVRHLVDALRLVPGVHVAQIQSDQWAVGTRGFTDRLSRSMLVLIDGRAVYTPLFAGVYWQIQDTLLEDIDRIEVVRGPGGTLWGANAVNGVVNIVTKSAADTKGSFVAAEAGGERTSAAVRYGGTVGDDGHFRVYAKGFDRDAFYHPDGADYDDWSMAQGGFRFDWDRPSRDRLTFSGDVYRGGAGQRTSFASFTPPYSRTVIQDAELGGGNLVGRWHHANEDGGQVTLRGYLDHTTRNEVHFSEARTTFEVEVQYGAPAWKTHLLTASLGYRRSDGDADGVPAVAFQPGRRVDDLFSLHLQDEFTALSGRLRVFLGSKLEHNDYTGFEVQPTVRAIYTADDRQAVWAAVTRAVRTPSRLEHDLVLYGALQPDAPAFARFEGNRGFDAERVAAYESGYRLNVKEGLIVDLAAFANRSTNLLSLEPGAMFMDDSLPQLTRSILPFTFENRLDGQWYGLEASVDVLVGDAHWLRGGYSFLRLDLEPKPSSGDTTSSAAEGRSPRHQAFAHGMFRLPRRFQLDGVLRWVDELPAQNVGAYTSLDLRLAWTGMPWEIAIIGRNLLEENHSEFGSLGVGREVSAQLAWSW